MTNALPKAPAFRIEYLSQPGAAFDIAHTEEQARAKVAELAKLHESDAFAFVPNDPGMTVPDDMELVKKKVVPGTKCPFEVGAVIECKHSGTEAAVEAIEPERILVRSAGTATNPSGRYKVPASHYRDYKKTDKDAKEIGGAFKSSGEPKAPKPPRDRSHRRRATAAAH